MSLISTERFIYYKSIIIIEGVKMMEKYEALLKKWDKHLDSIEDPRGIFPVGWPHSIVEALLHPENRVGPKGETERAFRLAERFAKYTEEFLREIEDYKKTHPEATGFYDELSRDVREFSTELIEWYKRRVTEISEVRRNEN